MLLCHSVVLLLLLGCEFENEKDGLNEYIVQENQRKKRNKNFQRNKRERKCTKKRRNKKKKWVGRRCVAGRERLRMLPVKPISLKYKPGPKP